MESTNTPIDHSAPSNVVDMLWKHRFNIDIDIIHKMNIYVNYYTNWSHSPSGEFDTYYYKLHPEYTIELRIDESGTKKILFILFK